MPTLSSRGLLESKPMRQLSLWPPLEELLHRPLLRHPRQMQSVLKAQVAPEADAALHRHLLLAKVAPTRRRNQRLLRLVSHLRQPDDSLHLLRLQMLANSPSRPVQHTQGAHELSPMLHRDRLHLRAPRRLQWRIHSPARTDLECLRLSQGIVRSQDRLHPPVAALFLQVLHLHLLV